MAFNRNEISAFYIEDVTFNETTLEAKLGYSFDRKYFFEEIYTFHNATLPKDELARAALDNALKHFHIMAGVSYYKAAIPEKIILSHKISERTAKFFNEVYTSGLSEFAYVNKLDLENRIQFPFDKDHKDQPSSLSLQRRSLVPVGGGKDSVVTVEILKEAHESISLFIMGGNKTIHKVAEISELPIINVSRKISPMLLELNSQGAYNGHVPVSAILSFLLTVTAVLYFFDSFVMSYEHSASSPTLESNGKAVNHQYSKSLECEKLIKEHIQGVLLENLSYFSMIRPLSELKITSIFSKYLNYHQDFTSCNAHFRIGQDNSKWCNNCPKCRFVFLALAPFMEKTELINIFGVNLLNEESQLKGFQELSGLSGHKPFECVGEIDECRYALKLLAEKSDWKNDLIVRLMIPEISEIDIKDYINYFSNDHLLPKHYLEILNAYCRP